MRRGLTLLELLLAIVISGLLLGVSLPRFAAARDRLMVDEEVRRLTSAHRRARITAILQSRAIVLFVSADSLSLSDVVDPAVSWREPGPASRGVGLAGGARQIIFSPVGMSMGVSNASFRLSRGSATRTVVVSRLGRVRVQ